MMLSRVTRLLTASSCAWDQGLTKDSSGTSGFTPEGDYHSGGGLTIPTRLCGSGSAKSHVCPHIPPQRATCTDHPTVISTYIEQVIIYSCTVRMLLLPSSNLPNVELNSNEHFARVCRNARARTSNSLPSKMYPSLRPLCPGRLEMAAYRRPAPN